MRLGRSKNTALLLVDFINLFDFRGAQKLAPRAVASAHRTAVVKEWAHKQRVPCIYINDNFGDWTRPFEQLVVECGNKKGPSGMIAEVLKPRSGDLSILKPRHSAFYGTPLDFILDELKISRLILTGISADSCVFATAQDAHVRQFKLRIPSDCVAAETRAHERAALDHMARTVKADIRPSRL